jgi:hypothetical protein
MALVRIKFISEKPATAELVLARTLCQDSVATLQKKAKAREAIADIPIFAGAWQENRVRLPDWLKLIQSERTAFAVSEIRDGKEEMLSASGFAARIAHLRGTELETQMHTDLEEGFITRPQDFKAHDENWSSPEG